MFYRGEELVLNSCDFFLKEFNNIDIIEDGYFFLDLIYFIVMFYI